MKLSFLEKLLPYGTQNLPLLFACTFYNDNDIVTDKIVQEYWFLTKIPDFGTGSDRARCSWLSAWRRPWRLFAASRWSLRSLSLWSDRRRRRSRRTSRRCDRRWTWWRLECWEGQIPRGDCLRWFLLIGWLESCRYICHRTPEKYLVNF